MIAHYHGQVWNAAHLARSLGASENTACRYFVILAGAYMIRILPPWFENIRKRQVKAHKIYVRDSGILHALLQLRTLADLQSHPNLGASWEGFALEQLIQRLRAATLTFGRPMPAPNWISRAGCRKALWI